MHFWLCRDFVFLVKLKKTFFFFFSKHSLRHTQQIKLACQRTTCQPWQRLLQSTLILMKSSIVRHSIVLFKSQHYALFTQTVALPIFVMYDQFCQAVCPIFQLGIFLHLSLILCDVISLGQMLTKVCRTAKIGLILAVSCK